MNEPQSGADLPSDALTHRRTDAPSHPALKERLRADLAETLPGLDAQMRMAPSPLGGSAPSTLPPALPGSRSLLDAPPDARQGGVLVLLYVDADVVRIPLILRPTYAGVHSGQVGFPGGGREPSDADLTATALREAYEEVGVEPNEVEVLGHLTRLFVFASNYVVLPTVAWCNHRPAFNPDPYEVAKLIEAPLATLLDPATTQREEWQLRNRPVDVPFYAVEGQKVWGATAMMLSEFLSLPSLSTC